MGVQVASLRKLIAKVTADKHEEVLCRMGAIMAGGILDAGGRNMTVVRALLVARSGLLGRCSVLWAQYAAPEDMAASLYPPPSPMRAQQSHMWHLNTAALYTHASVHTAAPALQAPACHLDLGPCALARKRPAIQAKALSEPQSSSLAPVKVRPASQGLRSASGYFRRTSVVALAVFTHHWYWFALSYFLSLALKPSVLIGLSPRMVLPKMQARPSCPRCDLPM